ncbi:hypothetical protein FQA39_LY17376 [Lamprigera yunnana]|nr:hypothetical protein FQA39_LY17376 [Lamprigera yunnana]
MSSKRRRSNDDDDDFEYEPTDSESENEKQTFRDILNENQEESDEEIPVYGVEAESSSDDDSNIALSDVEGQGDEDYLPNVRAWGKDKRSFYATDYVDPDYGGYHGKDAIRADQEEEEAKNLQKQLIDEMDEDDFAFDFVGKDSKTEEKQPEELIKKDISQLSRRQRIELLQKESPEFFGLVEDFKGKMSLLKEFINPVLELWKKNKVKDSNAMQFARTYQEVVSNYCTNINMYLLLKASRVNVHNHPVIKRLFQFRKLLTQLDPIFETVMKSQMKLLIDSFEMSEKKENSKKLLNVLQKSTKKKNLILPKEVKAVKFDEKIEDTKKSEEPNDEREGEEDSRRAITYQIAKNKGLTPHRNKLQRNPRVKHRNKYRRALIRRKGAVRTVRTELTRYGGELSGIKATVSKSIKIKS